jgi:hypothetical protein
MNRGKTPATPVALGEPISDRFTPRSNRLEHNFQLAQSSVSDNYSYNLRNVLPEMW